MARRRHLPSLVVPIAFGAVAVPASTALLVGWSVLFGLRIAERPGAWNIGLLVLGAVAFVAVITILVLLSLFLAREIREVRRQDSFIDSVTHELKSPLASLKLCAETLGRRDLDAPQQERLRGMMLDDLDRLSAFIDDVLQASRLAHESVAVNVCEVDVGALASRCVAAITARHHLDAARVAVDVPAGLVTCTDRSALEVVVKNLLDNAVKYSRDEVDVRLRARAGEGGVVWIEVEDHGIGIAPDDLRRVFDRFYRADDEAVRRRHGTGLGLYVASSLIRNLGGVMTARSAGREQGTTMCVRLPGAGAMAS